MSDQELPIRERIAQVLNIIDQAEIEEIAQIRAENRVWIAKRKAELQACSATFDQIVEEELEIVFDGWSVDNLELP